MIVDTHCHAWRRWPYDSTVPDPSTRGSMETLLYEMDHHGVGHAAVVCARIGGGSGGSGEGNADNNDYVMGWARRHPDRITALIDVDSVWLTDHHSAGSADRLRSLTDTTDARGFTHYVAETNDGWLAQDDGREFFRVAAERSLVASLAIGAAWFDDLAAVALDNPSLQILVHHLSNPPHTANRERDVEKLLGLAALQNIGVKVSGFNYNSATTWDYPYPDSIELFRRIHAKFGASRLYWGSDFPASRDDLTYRQSLELVRTHAPFLDEAGINAVLGGNAVRLFGLTDSSPQATEPIAPPNERETK